LSRTKYRELFNRGNINQHETLFMILIQFVYSNKEILICTISAILREINRLVC